MLYSDTTKFHSQYRKNEKENAKDRHFFKQFQKTCNGTETAKAYRDDKHRLTYMK